MTHEEMKTWEPDPRAIIFELTYYYIGLGPRTISKCPNSARMAIRGFAEDTRVQSLSVTPLFE